MAVLKKEAIINTVIKEVIINTVKERFRYARCY
jgi:hypothetical protein